MEVFLPAEQPEKRLTISRKAISFTKDIDIVLFIIADLIVHPHDHRVYHIDSRY